MKGVINIQNEDKGWFRNVDKECAKQLNFKSAKCPVHSKNYAKIHKQNNIFIDVFAYEDERPYHIYNSKQTFEKHVDL